MKIGVDFDRVLFKTDEFNEYLKEKTGLHHVDEDVYDDNGNYSPEKHAEACGLDSEKIYDAIEDLNQFLYSDIDNLRKLKEDHKLVIVTRGDEKLQKEKVKNSGAARLFDEIFIVQEGSKNVGGIDFLVDDREDEIENSGLPGMVFKRGKDTIGDVVKKVKNKYEA